MRELFSKIWCVLEAIHRGYVCYIVRSRALVICCLLSVWFAEMFFEHLLGIAEALLGFAKRIGAGRGRCVTAYRGEFM